MRTNDCPWFAAVALLALGCGGDDDGSAPDANPASDAQSTADAATDATALALCDKPTAPLAGRQLGFDILNVTETGTFDDNVAIAMSAGMDFIALHVTWSSIETAPGVFTDPGGAIGALSAVAVANNLDFSLTIRPIDLTGKTVPADLSTDPMTTHRFNTALMQSRFTAMVDYVLTNLVDPSILVSLQVGNEIDGFDASGEHPEFWPDYGEFLFAVNGFLDTNYPGVPMGFTVTREGAVSGALRDAGVWTAYAGAVDVVGVTYYPLAANFDVEAPDSVHDDLDELVTEFAATGKPIYLQEVGYQTSAQNASSDAMQASFLCEFFEAWDTHRAAIPAANFVRLIDVSLADAEATAIDYGLAGNVPFIEYIRTLGLRTFAGTGDSKPGFDVILEEVADRTP